MYFELEHENLRAAMDENLQVTLAKNLRYSLEIEESKKIRDQEINFIRIINELYVNSKSKEEQDRIRNNSLYLYLIELLSYSPFRTVARIKEISRNINEMYHKIIKEHDVHTIWLLYSLPTVLENCLDLISNPNVIDPEVSETQDLIADIMPSKVEMRHYIENNAYLFKSSTCLQEVIKICKKELPAAVPKSDGYECRKAILGQRTYLENISAIDYQFTKETNLITLNEKINNEIKNNLRYLTPPEVMKDLDNEIKFVMQAFKERPPITLTLTFLETIEKEFYNLLYYFGLRKSNEIQIDDLLTPIKSFNAPEVLEINSLDSYDVGFLNAPKALEDDDLFYDGEAGSFNAPKVLKVNKDSHHVGRFFKGPEKAPVEVMSNIASNQVSSEVNKNLVGKVGIFKEQKPPVTKNINFSTQVPPETNKLASQNADFFKKEQITRASSTRAKNKTGSCKLESRGKTLPMRRAVCT